MAAGPCLSTHKPSTLLRVRAGLRLASSSVIYETELGRDIATLDCSRLDER